MANIAGGQFKKGENFDRGDVKTGFEGFITQTNNLLNKDLDFFINEGVSVVIHGNPPMNEKVYNITFDEYQASWDVKAYLVKLGHKRIALVSGSEGIWYGKLRRKEYFHAFQHFSVPMDPDSTIEVDSFDPEEGDRCMKKILAANPRPTIAFIVNDYIAIHALL